MHLAANKKREQNENTQQPQKFFQIEGHLVIVALCFVLKGWGLKAPESLI